MTNSEKLLKNELVTTLSVYQFNILFVKGVGIVRRCFSLGVLQFIALSILFPFQENTGLLLVHTKPR